MKFVRTRAFNREEGKFSIWTIIMSQADLKRIAKLHPKKLTMDPIMHFRVITNAGTDNTVSIAQIKNLTDLNSIIKKISFSVKYVEDDDYNMNVFFDADTPVTTIDRRNELITNIKYFFRYDFLGYKSGSFYRLFNDIFFGGNFCTIDGSSYLESDNNIPTFAPEEVDNILNFRKQLTAKSKEEYDLRNAAIKEDRLRKRNKSNASIETTN